MSLTRRAEGWARLTPLATLDSRGLAVEGTKCQRLVPRERCILAPTPVRTSVSSAGASLGPWGWGTGIWKDGWPIVTADKRRAAHGEHSIAVTDDGPIILTLT